MEVTKPAPPAPAPIPMPSLAPLADDAITIDDAMKALYYVSWAFTIDLRQVAYFARLDERFFLRRFAGRESAHFDVPSGFLLDG